MSMSLKWRICTIFSWLLGLFGLVYCGSRLVHYGTSLPEIYWNAALLIKSIGLVVVSISTAILMSENWRLLLLNVGYTISLRQSFAILGMSQIAKYIPGNVFQYIGRATIALREGIPTVTVALTITAETVYIISVIICIAIVGLLTDVKGYPYTLVSNIDGKIMPYIAIMLCVVIALSVLLYLVRLRLMKSIGVKSITLILVRNVLLYLAIFVLYGVIFKLIPWVIWGNPSPVALKDAIWKFALCWLAGFIVPGAPAGLGVREAMFTKLFAPELGEGGAACVALVFRALTTIGDLVTFGLAWWLGSRVLGKTALNAQDIP